MVFDPEEILSILDDCCDAFTFPMLDNGYVYLAERGSPSTDRGRTGRWSIEPAQHALAELARGWNPLRVMQLRVSFLRQKVIFT